MNRLIALAPLALVALIACSSGDDDAPACQIVGTYTTTDKKSNGTCPDVGSEPTTWTISASGAGYLVETAGASGACSADKVGTCKIQGKCDVKASDPVDPANDRGTIQFSWTFDGAGFKGSTIIAAPPTKALTSGCSSEYASTGSRK